MFAAHVSAQVSFAYSCQAEDGPESESQARLVNVQMFSHVFTAIWLAFYSCGLDNAWAQTTYSLIQPSEVWGRTEGGGALRWLRLRDEELCANLHN